MQLRHRHTEQTPGTTRPCPNLWPGARQLPTGGGRRPPRPARISQASSASGVTAHFPGQAHQGTAGRHPSGSADGRRFAARIASLTRLPSAWHTYAQNARSWCGVKPSRCRHGLEQRVLHQVLGVEVLPGPGWQASVRPAPQSWQIPRAQLFARRVVSLLRGTATTPTKTPRLLPPHVQSSLLPHAGCTHGWRT